MTRVKELPPDFAVQRAKLIEEIHEAFRGVTREGGVSWSETYALDMYASIDERLKARASDKDTTWQSLVDFPDWVRRSNYGSWACLDPIGFRYYLPVAMIQSLNECTDSAEIQSYLTTSGDMSGAKSMEQRYWSSLDARQMTCVRDFVRCMKLFTKDDPYESASWGKTFASYWNNLDLHLARKARL